MSKTYATPGQSQHEELDKAAVEEFFNQRAKKIELVGPLRAVIYQDKNPDLAERRNKAEKEKLLPLLKLDGTQRILDIGCGTGRWAQDLSQACTHYHGIDACAGLIDYAKTQFPTGGNCKFSVNSATSFSLQALNEHQQFDRALCLGVLIYLNDSEIGLAVRAITAALSVGGSALFREPVGLGKRLTISQHHSEDMDQSYSAIYRTKDELLSLILDSVPENTFSVIGYGDVYDEPDLNNRSDTKQQWFLLERKK